MNCPDEIINGNFKGNLGGWDYDSDWWGYNNGGAVHNSGDTNSLSQHGTLDDGDSYFVRATIGGTVGTVTIKLGGSGTSQTYNSGVGNIVFEGVWSGDYKIAFYPSIDSDVRIDNVSIRAVSC